MAMRLQELHPSAVHFPIALFPLSLAADALGRLTGSRSLLEVGRLTMPLAAASVAVSGVLGLIAQESVKTDEHSGPILDTHRNLNLGLLGLSALMARKRARTSRPGLGYLALGAVGAATMTYSAYLGGHMVYEHGVGVSPANGLLEDRAPKLTPDNAGEAIRLSGEHVRKGVQHAVENLRSGPIVPALPQPV